MSVRLVFLLLIATSFTASAQQFVSSEVQVPLIELYTSEGCSSCPPADRWLSSMVDTPGLWRDYVPVAFHVDYWNYLGWRDPFASREYSQRQRRYAKYYDESTVYTPGVRRAGAEWRAWRKNSVASLEELATVGVLTFELDQSGEYTAHFKKASSGKNKLKSPVLNVAVLGLGLSTEVRRGENKGKTLKHDFVVLGLTRQSGSDALQWQGSLPSVRTSAPSYSVAAWISDGPKPTPIQSVGGYIEQGTRVVVD